jgi:hypothetical protein
VGSAGSRFCRYPGDSYFVLFKMYQICRTASVYFIAMLEKHIKDLSFLVLGVEWRCATKKVSNRSLRLTVRASIRQVLDIRHFITALHRPRGILVLLCSISCGFCPRLAQVVPTSRGYPTPFVIVLCVFCAHGLICHMQRPFSSS